MKLFLFLITIFLTMGCTKEKEFEQLGNLYMFSNVYNSKDSIHHYAIDKNNLYKQKKNESTLVWEKPCSSPEPKIIDLGYGETKKIDYQPSVILDTDKSIFTLWTLIYRKNVNSTKEEYEYVIGLYSSNGDFIKNEKIDWNGTPIRQFVEMYNQDILIIGSSDYSVIDKKLNFIKQTNNIKLPSLKFVKFISEERYVSYDNSSIILFDWVNKKDISPDLESFISRRFPNEIHIPKFSLININLKSDYLEALMKVTLYSGKIESFNVKISYALGEIIE